MSLFDRLKTLLDITEATISLNEIAFQNKLAPVLRRIAIAHLRYSKSVVAASFRGEYLASGLGDYQDFLNQQAQVGTWGTYIEATALGEALGVNVVAIPEKINGDEVIEQDPICLYRAADPKAPTIYLYNCNNTHWYVNANTQGNGDCLFNALAQALQAHCQKELPVASPVKKPTLFALPQSSADESVERYKTIEVAVLQQLTPAEMEKQFVDEKARVSQLPPAEQQQIATDHQLALKLAREEEAAYAKSNHVFSRCGTHTEHAVTSFPRMTKA
jgi:hypothetical protein